MAVMCEEENRCLTAAVSGELDHHRAKEVMEELDRRSQKIGNLKQFHTVDRET